MKKNLLRLIMILFLVSNFANAQNTKTGILLNQIDHLNKIKEIKSYFGRDDITTYNFELVRDVNTNAIFLKSKFKEDKVYFKGRYIYDVMIELEFELYNVIYVEERGNSLYFNLNSNGFRRRVKVPGENWTRYFDINKDFSLTIYNSEKRKEALKAFKYLVEHPYINR